MKKVIPGKIKTQLRLDGYYNVLNKYGTQHLSLIHISEPTRP